MSDGINQPGVMCMKGSVHFRKDRGVCKVAGESISMYDGLKHSSCSQYVNEKQMALSDLQTITDHARLDSVKRYAKVEVSRRRELMERKVISIKKMKADQEETN